jgi:CubicO group peptidase (beta-lactamase class C family)
MRIISLVVLLVSLVAPASAGGDRFAPAIDTLIEPLIDGEVCVGLAVGILHGGETVTFGYGRISTGGTKAPDENTIFEIGSMTKVFTALLLADAVMRGDMALEDPVASLLPSTVRVPSDDNYEITLSQLATHTSGLPRMPDNFRPQDPSNPYKYYNVQRLYEFLAGYSLTVEPGSRYEYSNLGMGLLGHALSAKYRARFEKLLRERIWEPLDMKNTFIVVPPDAQARTAPGHNVDGTEVSSWEFFALAGAGAVRSTIADLLLFLSANANPGDTPLGEAMVLTHRKRSFTASGVGQVGLGWHYGELSDSPWHNGRTGGYASFANFDPDAKTAVVVLANTSTPLVDQIGAAISRIVSGEDAAPIDFRRPADVDPAIFDDYTGHFTLFPGFDIVITRDGNRLMAQATGQESFRLYPESQDTFFYRVVDAQIKFARDDDGHVDKLILFQNGREMPGTRTGDSCGAACTFASRLRGVADVP